VKSERDKELFSIQSIHAFLHSQGQGQQRTVVHTVELKKKKRSSVQHARANKYMRNNATALRVLVALLFLVAGGKVFKGYVGHFRANQKIARVKQRAVQLVEKAFCARCVRILSLHSHHCAALLPHPSPRRIHRHWTTVLSFTPNQHQHQPPPTSIMDIAKEKLHDIRVQLDKYPVLQDLEVSK